MMSHELKEQTKATNSIFNMTREDYIHEQAAKDAESYLDIFIPKCLKKKMEKQNER